MRGITEDEYNKRHKKYRTKQKEIHKKIISLEQADEEYYITANYLLNLANRAYELFKSSEKEQKRQLINLTLQNLKLEDGKLQYDVKSPFNKIFFYAKRSEWLPLLDAIRTLENFLYNMPNGLQRRIY